MAALHTVFEYRFGIVAAKKIDINVCYCEPAFLIQCQLKHPRIPRTDLYRPISSRTSLRHRVFHKPFAVPYTPEPLLDRDIDQLYGKRTRRQKNINACHDTIHCADIDITATEVILNRLDRRIGRMEQLHRSLCNILKQSYLHILKGQKQSLVYHANLYNSGAL